LGTALAAVTAALSRWAPESLFVQGATPGRRAPTVARSAADRVAHIALVDVDVTPGQENAFLGASLENARASVREDMNRRFDVLQSRDEQNRFVLVEVYDGAEGPVEHKGTEHYLAWRDAVAGIMNSPRKAAQWDTIYPEKVDGLKSDVLLFERESPFLDITHVYVDVKPGSEEAFIKASMTYVDTTVKEERPCMRYDIFRNVDDPTKFLMIQVWRNPTETDLHRRTDNFARWRGRVADMMATPRVFKKYINHFPSVPAAWRVDTGSMW